MNAETEPASDTVTCPQCGRQYGARNRGIPLPGCLSCMGAAARAGDQAVWKQLLKFRSALVSVKRKEQLAAAQPAAGALRWRPVAR